MTRMSLLGRPLSPAFRLRLTVVLPGAAHSYDEADWTGALVVVEHGEIDLDGCDGSRCRLVAGDVLWLAGLRLRALHNRGDEPVLLSAVSRA